VSLVRSFVPIPEFAAFAIGFAICYALHPLVIRVARDRALLDIPDEIRHHHSSPTPRLGGIAIFVAALATSILVLLQDPGAAQAHYPLAPQWPGVLIGAAIVFVAGLLDDLRGLKPGIKLTIHFIAALFPIAYGFRIEAIRFGGTDVVHLGFLAIPITVLWVVGLTNAFNLIDGVDGLAATCALIALGTTMLAEVMFPPVKPLAITAALFGAVLAFLRFNRPPARIFLGDSGSTMLGFFIGIRVAVGATDEHGATYVAIALLAVAYPVLDTGVAIVRRWLRGHKFSRADGRHIHHQFLALGLSSKRTVELLGLSFSAVAVLGLCIAVAPPQVTALLVVIGAIVFAAAGVYGARWLGYVEFLEFGASIASVARNARRHVQNKIVANDVAQSLGGAHSLQDLNQILEQAALELGFVQVSIETDGGQVSMPRQRQIAPLDQRPFRVDCPIAWEMPDGHVREIILRFWCDSLNGRQYFGAERIAARLAPAVQRWFRTHTPSHGVIAVPDGVRLGVRSSGERPAPVVRS